MTEKAALEAIAALLDGMRDIQESDTLDADDVRHILSQVDGIDKSEPKKAPNG